MATEAKLDSKVAECEFAVVSAWLENFFVGLEVLLRTYTTSIALFLSCWASSGLQSLFRGTPMTPIPPRIPQLFVIWLHRHPAHLRRTLISIEKGIAILKLLLAATAIWHKCTSQWSLSVVWQGYVDPSVQRKQWGAIEHRCVRCREKTREETQFSYCLLLLLSQSVAQGTAALLSNLLTVIHMICVYWLRLIMTRSHTFCTVRARLSHPHTTWVGVTLFFLLLFYYYYC